MAGSLHQRTVVIAVIDRRPLYIIQLHYFSDLYTQAHVLLPDTRSAVTSMWIAVLDLYQPTAFVTLSA